MIMIISYEKYNIYNKYHDFSLFAFTPLTQGLDLHSKGRLLINIYEQENYFMGLI